MSFRICSDLFNKILAIHFLLFSPFVFAGVEALPGRVVWIEDLDMETHNRSEPAFGLLSELDENRTFRLLTGINDGICRFSRSGTELTVHDPDLIEKSAVHIALNNGETSLTSRRMDLVRGAIEPLLESTNSKVEDVRCRTEIRDQNGHFLVTREFFTPSGFIRRDVYRYTLYEPLQNVEFNLVTSLPAAASRPVERWTLSDESLPDRFKPLAESVLAIADTSPDQPVHKYNLRYGSMIILSENGIVATNHHVWDRISSCQNRLTCSIRVRQVRRDGSSHYQQVTARLLVLDSTTDFALLQLNLPREWPRTPLTFETKRIGPDFLIVGFPSDKEVPARSQVFGWPLMDSELTFSQGPFTGMRVNNFVSQAKASPGNSGGPAISVESLKLIGIVTHNFSEDKGDMSPSPSGITPIQVLEHQFHVSKYVSGEMQRRVDQLIQQIAICQFAYEAQPFVEAYKNLKTFYGADSLIKMMTDHRSPHVRPLLRRTLQQVGILNDL